MSRLDQRGFSLVEVLLALFLLGLGVLSVAPLFLFAERSNANGADGGRVAAAVTERLENLRTLDYADLIAGGSLTDDVTGYVDTTDPDVTVRWKIEDNTTPPGTKTVTVRSEARRQVVGQPRRFTAAMLRAR